MTNINVKADVQNYPAVIPALGLNDLIIALEKQRLKRHLNKKVDREVERCMFETGMLDDETLDLLQGR